MPQILVIGNKFLKYELKENETLVTNEKDLENIKDKLFDEIQIRTEPKTPFYWYFRKLERTYKLHQVMKGKFSWIKKDLMLQMDQYMN